MDTYRFSESFWDCDLIGTSGFDTLVRRLKDGRKLCKDMEEYYRQRSKIEGQYAKELQKLTKNMEQREENGVLEESWNAIRTQTESLSHHHDTASNYFSALMSDLERLNDNLKIRGKQIEDRTTKSHNMAKGYFNKHNNLKKTYEQKCMDYGTIQNDNKYSDPVDQKTAQKQKTKEAKAKDEMEKADCQYRITVDALQSAQKTWEEDMENACQVYQDLDVERIEVIRDVMWKGTNVDSQMCVDHDMCSEYIRKHLEKCIISTEIRTFVERARVGHRRPAMTDYQNYFKGMSPNLNRKRFHQGTAGRKRLSTDTSQSNEESIYQTVK
ncbi:proline-serine-threonine phosphatase-interacting protein 1-like [Mizuhopecten yessoensis]|uniref:Proline-serine-threonine phosphatase-interacting protein 1 n=1 Tax=Mizuhopecten yessoensis TaxID=6573 RepID=A0A210PUW4_MIZYE|nr:proline-serine-threonine phosphatase-interacting protein 1-like [Mizuhopecten yessoensis]OWF40273.1 Proline-serine-threonine phosphatase-interacting protein 1 [Mizuhopecten yessoensis]